jgi:ParB family transcriptional regulator, chromosome partitioning protein
MRRALGKGLSQLIGEQADSTPTEAAIDTIVPNRRQPRSVFEEEPLQELAASIRSVGVLQPLVVRPLAEGRYELIAGERRLRAAKLAGLTEVPIIVRSAGHQTSLEMALIENLQREDIGPMECARAYRKLMDEFSMTQEQVAERVGKSRTAIANTVRLLRLPKRVQEGLESGEISEGHGRALLSIEDEALQLALYDQIVKRGLTVRDVERLVQARQAEQKPATSKPATPPLDPEWAALQDGLSTYFSTPVRLQRGEAGGKIILDFYSDDDLQRILDILGMQLDR